MYVVDMHPNGERPSKATVKLDRAVYDELEDYIVKGHRGEGGMRKFVNDTVSSCIRMHRVMDRLENPFLRLVGTDGNQIFVNDMKSGDVARVQVSYVSDSDNRVVVECLTDKRSKSCVHVAFCLNNPELGKLDISKGDMADPEAEVPPLQT